VRGGRIGALALVAVAAAGFALAEPYRSPAPAPKPPGIPGASATPEPVEAAALEMQATELNQERISLHPDLRLIGAATLFSPDERFGGLSGLVWGPEQGLSAISDRGWRIMGLPDRVAPPPPGPLSMRMAPLRDEYGQPLPSFDSDAESVALDPRGGWLVSFEGAHRIWRYPGVTGPALPLRGVPEWEQLQPNSGLEAIATAPGGVLYAIPERSGAEDRPFPVWRRAGDAWDTLYLPRTGDFLVTDAAIGPDGQLYVLERSLSLLGGWAMRIRRTPVDGLPDGAELKPETMATFLAGSGVDNMEGMTFAPAIPAKPRADRRREVRLLVISDDNFRFFQRTLLIEFRLVY